MSRKEELEILTNNLFNRISDKYNNTLTYQIAENTYENYIEKIKPLELELNNYIEEYYKLLNN